MSAGVTVGQHQHREASGPWIPPFEDLASDVPGRAHATLSSLSSCTPQTTGHVINKPESQGQRARGHRGVSDRHMAALAKGSLISSGYIPSVDITKSPASFRLASLRLADLQFTC